MVVLKSGANVSAGTVSVGSLCSVLKIKHHGSSATIKLNGCSIVIDSNNTYETFEVDFNSFEIVSGAVDYVAIG
jgi:hypothetical protein